MFDKDKLNQLYRYAVSLTANKQLAWDLVQDAVEKIISRRFIMNKMAYAKTTIRNQFYDFLTSKAHTTVAPFNDKELFVEDNIDGLIDARLTVEKIMEKLNSLDRELLFLWAVEEYTTKEISVLMNIPKGTVTSRLKRLRDRLQKDLGGKVD